MREMREALRKEVIRLLTTGVSDGGGPLDSWSAGAIVGWLEAAYFVDAITEDEQSEAIDYVGALLKMSFRGKHWWVEEAR